MFLFLFNILFSFQIIFSKNYFPNSKIIYVGETKFADKVSSDNHISDFEPTNDDEAQDKSSSLYFWEIYSNGTQIQYILSESDMNDVYTLGHKLTKQSSSQYSQEEGNQKNELSNQRRLSILGSDTRWEVTDASIKPWKYVGLIQSNVGTCTGILVGPKHVLTAAQCVRSRGSTGVWHNNVHFYPSRTRTSASIAYDWSRMNVFSGWISDLSNVNDYHNFDMALITLSSSPNIGQVAFGFDYGLRTGYYTSLYSKGYPLDKSFGSMWATWDYLYASWDYGLMTDDSDTYNGGGYRGAPWYVYESSGPVVYAVDTDYGINFNIHTKITSSKFYSLCSWINDASIGC